MSGNIEIMALKCTVKSTVHGTWKYTVKSTVHGKWKQYGKQSISSLMPKYSELRDDTRPDSHVSALWTFYIVKDDIYFLPYYFTNINVCH